MNKPLIIYLLAILTVFQVSAEEQFASRIIKYSSQAGSKGYAAKQVLGLPNALDYGKNPVAWAPDAANLGTEFIEVGFDKPMRIQQVAVWENFHPGAVFQIHLIDVNGKSHKVYEQEKPEKLVPRTRIFRYMMKMTSYEVKGIKLVLNTAEVYGLNQIDAIGISSTTEPMQSIIRNPADETFIGKPENLGEQVNSADPDLLPFISVDGQTIYFARKNHINNIGPEQNDDIYTAHKEKNGKWSEAYNIGTPLNNRYNNFVCAVNPDGTEVLLSGRYETNGIAKEGLHRTTYKNGIWSSPTPITIDNYKNSSPFVCYHVSPDMKFLVIAMEHPDTYGDMDIYVSQRKSDGRYSTPKNLGPVINTAGTEPSVFLSADGKTIYFASDGHPGYGAYDMYMSRRLDNSWTKWSEPVNLGPGINTPDWDLYYTVPASGEYAYYSSEHNSIGRSDLFRIKLPKDVRPEPVAIVKPSFINLKTNSPVAKLEKENKAIVIQDDSKLNLYEEVKGYYPVNTSKDLSDVLEEEDDFDTDNSKKKNDKKEDVELESKMEDLLARLQELKNEQASAENQYEDLSKEPEVDPSGSAEREVKEYTSPRNDLDDRLAALRSDMERINQGKQPDNSYQKDEAKKTYNVKPATRGFDDQMAQEQAFHEQQKAYQSDMESDREALSDFDNNNYSVAPRVQQRKSYDLREEQPDEYREEYMDYRNRIEQLKADKHEVAASPQPLTKYALQRTAIDEETHDELVASSMKSELDAVREKQDPETVVNPEIEAYRKKLEDLRKEPETVNMPTGTRITTKPAEDLISEEEAAEVDEEILAFQKKLEEMKQKMNDIPTVFHADEEEVVAKLEETDEAEVPKVTEPEVVKTRRNKPKKEAPEPLISEEETVVAETETADPYERSVVPASVVDITEVEPAAEPETDAIKLEDATIDSDEAAQLNEELNEEIRQLNEEAESAREATANALKEKEDAEAAKSQLEAEKAEMEQQKQELEDILTQLEEERTQFMKEQEKLEKERKQLEDLRLQQHLQVKQLETEIAALLSQKNKVQPTAEVAKNTNPAGASGDMDDQIFLMPLEVGVTVEVRNVFFNANSAYIKPQSYSELDRVATFLKVNSKISVEIGGHTNGLCQASFCNTLSLRRANSVRDYLISSGISPDRLNAKGYGKEKPLADNSSSAGRKKNQRVELKILEVE